MSDTFTFLDPGKLIDGNLELILLETSPADPKKNYVPAYKFEMRDLVSGDKMGFIDLRIGNNENIYYGGHIGYGVDEPYRGNRYAARSILLLIPFVKKHNPSSFYITCDPDNIASRKSIERAGGVLEETVDIPEHNEMYKQGKRTECRYRFDL